MKSLIYATKATLCLESSIPSGNDHVVALQAMHDHILIFIQATKNFGTGRRQFSTHGKN